MVAHLSSRLLDKGEGEVGGQVVVLQPHGAAALKLQQFIRPGSSEKLLLDRDGEQDRFVGAVERKDEGVTCNGLGSGRSWAGVRELGVGYGQGCAGLRCVQQCWEVQRTEVGLPGARRHGRGVQAGVAVCCARIVSVLWTCLLCVVCYVVLRVLRQAGNFKLQITNYPASSSFLALHPPSVADS